jgi:hypothetical protein
VATSVMGHLQPSRPIAIDAAHPQIAVNFPHSTGQAWSGRNACLRSDLTRRTLRRRQTPAPLRSAGTAPGRRQAALIDLRLRFVSLSNWLLLRRLDFSPAGLFWPPPLPGPCPTASAADTAAAFRSRKLVLDRLMLSLQFVKASPSFSFCARKSNRKPRRSALTAIDGPANQGWALPSPAGHFQQSRSARQRMAAASGRRPVRRALVARNLTLRPYAESSKRMRPRNVPGAPMPSLWTISEVVVDAPAHDIRGIVDRAGHGARVGAISVVERVAVGA